MNEVVKAALVCVGSLLGIIVLVGGFIIGMYRAVRWLIAEARK